MKANFTLLLVILSIIILLSPMYSQDGKLQTNPEVINKIDSLSNSMNEQFQKLRANQLNKDIELAKQHIERANRIIDWSAMIFTALAILLVIAGAVGLKQFSQIRRTEQNMKDMLAMAQIELREIQKYRDEIISETKIFMELTYYLNEGISTYHSGNYLRARELLYKVIDIKENHVEALYFIGKSLVMEGKQVEATAEFEKIIRISPNYSNAYLGLAQNYFDTDEKKSIAYCQKAVEVEPENSSAWDFMGLVYQQTDQIDDAFVCAISARNIRRCSTTAYFISTLYYVKDDLTNAKKYFDEAKYLAYQDIEKVQKIHWAHFYIGVIEGLSNNLKEAKSHFRKSQEYNKSPAIQKGMINQLKFLSRHKPDNKNIKAMLAYLENKA